MREGESDRMTMSAEILKEENMKEEDGIIESEDEDIDVGSNESYRWLYIIINEWASGEWTDQ